MLCKPPPSAAMFGIFTGSTGFENSFLAAANGSCVCIDTEYGQKHRFIGFEIIQIAPYTASVISRCERKF